MELTFLTNLLYIFFIITSFFAALLSLLKSTVTVFNLSISKSSIFDFKLAKSGLLANCDASTAVVFLLRF